MHCLRAVHTTHSLITPSNPDVATCADWWVFGYARNACLQCATRRPADAASSTRHVRDTHRESARSRWPSSASVLHLPRRIEWILLTVVKRISVHDRCFIFGGRSLQVRRDLLAQRIRHPLRFLGNGCTEKTHVASKVLFEKQLNDSTWRSRRGERTRCARKCPHHIVDAEQHAVAIEQVKVV